MALKLPDNALETHRIVRSFSILLPNPRQLRDSSSYPPASDGLAEDHWQASLLGPLVGAFLAADGGVELVMRLSAEVMADFVRQSESNAFNPDLAMAAEAAV